MGFMMRNYIYGTNFGRVYTCEKGWVKHPLTMVSYIRNKMLIYMVT